MAEARQNRIKRLVFVALCLSVCGVVCAQPDPANLSPLHTVQVQSPLSGSLAGRLTDLHSSPLSGVHVVLRNQATGVALQTTTAKNGSFRFASLEAGEYTLEADERQLGQGWLEGILVTGGTEARVQAAMRFEPPAPALLEAAPPRPSATVSAPQATPLPAATPSSLPVAIRTALSTSSPALIASIAAEPLRNMPSTALRVEEIVRPPVQTEAPARTQPPHEAPPAIGAAKEHRTDLETQSVSAQPALALVLLQTLPLPAGSAPSLNAGVALARALQALVQFNMPPLVPILAAVKRVDPVTPAVATTVSAAQLQALPASGRRWQEFLLDTPVASASADSSHASFRAAQETAEITIDGAGTRLAFGVAAGSASGERTSDPSGQGPDQQGSMSQAWNGGRGLNVSEAAIHEVTTVAGNVEAEGLRSAGGRAAIHTESGADALHGQSFLFDRQNTWGARNPFTQWVQFNGFSTTSAPNYTSQAYTPSDHETVWGIGMGSRIRRDKLFWFAALDSYRRNDPGLATVKHPDQFFAQPSNAQMQLLSAQLGLSSANPTSEGLAAYSGMLDTLNGLLGPAPRTAAQWVGFARIDWHAAERHRFTLEGIGADWSSPGGGLTRVSETFGNHSFGSSQASQQWLLARWEAYLTPNLLAVTQSSAGRAILSARPDTPSDFEQGFLNGNIYSQLPQIVVDSRYGFTIGNPSRFGQGSYPDERLYHEQEMVDWVHNHLLVKAGFELDHNADATSLLRNQTGTYYYSKVENFISDALAFEKFGLVGLYDYQNPHNCNPSGTALGALPCDTYYSQIIGPAKWHMNTNDWAGYVTAQWQLNKFAVFSAGLRWEREQLPPPIAELNNPDLPFTERLPSLGNNWCPRLSLAIGSAQGRWPVLRLGYGMYYGRTENATVETALTQTGSFNGDLYYFIRPTDGLNPYTETSDAPLFPYVLEGQPSSVVKPGAVGFAPNFRNPEVHQAVAAIEQALPGRMELTASAMLSLGRRLPVSLDTNLDIPTPSPTITYAVVDGTGAGPIKAAKIKVPFYASWTGSTGSCPYYTPQTSYVLPGRPCPDYQQITEIMSRANSTYEAAMVKVVRYGRRGLSFHAHYTYAHATDWNPNETTLVAGSDVLDPANFSQEYGTSNLDVRHSAAVMAIYEAPWKLRDLAGLLGNGWRLSGIGQFRSGLPYTMRVTGSIPECVVRTGITSCTTPSWVTTATGDIFPGLGPGMNGSGGDNRIYWLDSDNRVHTIGRNTFRYPNAWKADLRLAKRFNLGETRELEVMAESFNLFNHQNVTEIETTGYYIENSSTSPTLNFMTGLKANTTAFGHPLNINATDFYRERQIQLGLRMRF